MVSPRSKVVQRCGKRPNKICSKQYLLRNPHASFMEKFDLEKNVGITLLIFGEIYFEKRKEVKGHGLT